MQGLELPYILRRFLVRGGENVNTGPTDPGGRGGKEKSAPPSTLGFPFEKKANN